MEHLWNHKLTVRLAVLSMSVAWPCGVTRGQTAAWHTVQLNYGIRLAVPHDWTTDQPAVATAIRADQRVVDASALLADENGHLIIFKDPSFDTNEVSLEIQVMPARISQAALARMSDAEIHAGIEADPDAHPTDEAFWHNAKVVLPSRKEVVTMRLDADLLAWFRQQRGYQTRINAILRSYMKAHASEARPR